MIGLCEHESITAVRAWKQHTMYKRQNMLSFYHYSAYTMQRTSNVSPPALSTHAPRSIVYYVWSFLASCVFYPSCTLPAYLSLLSWRHGLALYPMSSGYYYGLLRSVHTTLEPGWLWAVFFASDILSTCSTISYLSILLFPFRFSCDNDSVR